MGARSLGGWFVLAPRGGAERWEVEEPSVYCSLWPQGGLAFPSVLSHQLNCRWHTLLTVRPSWCPPLSPQSLRNRLLGIQRRCQEVQRDLLESLPPHYGGCAVCPPSSLSPFLMLLLSSIQWSCWTGHSFCNWRTRMRGDHAPPCLGPCAGYSDYLISLPSAPCL